MSSELIDLLRGCARGWRGTNDVTAGLLDDAAAEIARLSVPPSDDKRHGGTPLTEHEIMVLREEMLSDDGFLPEGKERVARLCDMALASIVPSAVARSDEWRAAALRLGEQLAPTGPNWYYAMTPTQWLDWCENSLPSASAARNGRVETARQALVVAADRLLTVAEMEERNEAIRQGKRGKAWDGAFVRREKLDAMEKVRTALAESLSGPQPTTWGENDTDGEIASPDSRSANG